MDAVLLKALDPNPDARYASAGELAADLERYLAGRPVVARPQTTWYLLRKWVMRHRWAVGGAAAALVAVVLGVGIYVVSMRRAYGEVRKAYSVSVDMLAGHVFQLQDGTGEGEAQLAARRRVMEKAIRDANRLAGQAGADDAVARTSAQAYAEMGQILEDAGEAEEAELCYRRATGPLEKLASAGPTKVRAALDLTVLQVRLTRLYLARGEAVAARRHFNSAERWLDVLEKDGGYAGHAPERLAYVRWGLTMERADLLLAEGKAAEALQAATAAMELTEPARRVRNPLLTEGTRLASLAKVADCNVKLFDQRPERAHLQRALDVLAQAVVIADARVKSNPGTAQLLVDLAVIESARGRIHLRTGAAADADASLQRAVESLDRALAADPARADWRRELLRALDASATAAEKRGDAKAADQFRRRSTELRTAGGSSQDGR
jgi:tetratricopeptide (TPR) repeat protein